MPVPVKAIAGLPLFSGLDTVELEEVASQLETAEHEAGRPLIKEGDPPGHPIFVLLSGNVDVVKRGLDGREHVISSLAAPSVFGEIEMLAKRPAIAGVTSGSPVKLALLRRGVFDEMCRAHRPAVLKVIKNLATTLSFRLAATDERMAAFFDMSTPEHREVLGKMRSTLYSSWSVAT